MVEPEGPESPSTASPRRSPISLRSWRPGILLAWLLVAALAGGGVAAGVTLGILRSQSRTNSQELNLGSRVSLTEDSATLQVAGHALPAVVSVVTNETGSEYGSGFLVTTDGYVVTAAGVIANAGTLGVLLPGEGRRHDARLVDYDCETGVAVLKVDQVGNLPTLAMGDSGQLKAGQTVIALGGPLGPQTLGASRGIVGALHRTTVAPRLPASPVAFSDTMLTDAGVAPGNAGGPLLNVSGQVVGIVLAAASGEVNATAVSSNSIRTEVQQIVDTGQLVVADLGVTVQDLSPEDGALRGLPAGALVTGLRSGSAADLAGLRAGDVLTELDGNRLDAAHPLTQVLRSGYRGGQRAAVSYTRGSASAQVQVTLRSGHPVCT